MNETLIERWNETVAPQDTVIHVGDVRHASCGTTTEWWLDQLNGDILLVDGNHDDAEGDSYHVVDMCQLQHDKYHFHVEHKPVGVAGWNIHGHVHNSDTFTYPLCSPERQTVNVSAELLGYRPLSMDRLTRLLDKNQRFEALPEHERQI